MKIQKMFWWTAAILLLFSIIVCVVIFRQAGSRQFRIIDQLLTSIEQSPTEWGRIEIGGTGPLIYYKSLWVNSSLLLDFATWSAVLFGLLALLLFMTLLYERRKIGEKQ